MSWFLTAPKPDCSFALGTLDLAQVRRYDQVRAGRVSSTEEMLWDPPTRLVVRASISTFETQ
ncbi:MAG: hypothetical protein ACE5JS_22670 [Nitrospinota bacterium]